MEEQDVSAYVAAVRLIDDAQTGNCRSAIAFAAAKPREALIL
ncbi:hypothetical protein ACVDG5_036675 [Mesorhizobium sp. ORM6]